MAIFAELNSDGGLVRSIEILDCECVDPDGVHQESIGIEFCQGLFGAETNWREAFYEKPDTGLWVQDASSRLWIPAT